MKRPDLVEIEQWVEVNIQLSDQRPPDTVVRRMEPLLAPYCPFCLKPEEPVPGVPYWGLSAVINIHPEGAEPLDGRDLATCGHCQSVMAVTYPPGRRLDFLRYFMNYQLVTSSSGHGSS